jgi:hypothetical protein
MNITKNEKNQIICDTPYNPYFVADLKKSIPNGSKKWDAENRVWIIEGNCEKTLNNLLAKHYNYQIGSKNIKIKLTALKDDYEYCDSVRVAGFPIARAWGRDSGARVCENVVLISGSIKSGGSMKNWCTKVAAGAVFEMTIPESAVENIDKEIWKVEIISKEEKQENPLEHFSTEALLAEIERRKNQ